MRLESENGNQKLELKSHLTFPKVDVQRMRKQSGEGDLMRLASKDNDCCAKGTKSHEALSPSHKIKMIIELKRTETRLYLMAFCILDL